MFDNGWLSINGVWMLNDMRFPLYYGPTAMIEGGKPFVYQQITGQSRESFSTDRVEISTIITISGASLGEISAFHGFLRESVCQMH